MLYVLNDFEWFRDRKGYRIVPFRSVRMTAAWKRFEATSPAPKQSDAFDERPWIVPKGEPGDAVRYKPFTGYADLSDAFASVKTPDDLLRFVNGHGALTWQGMRPQQTNAMFGDFSLAAEPVSHGLVEAQMFRELLQFRARGDSKGLASHFESKIAGFVGGGQAGRVEILPDYERGIRLKVTPPHLLGALWYQLALRLSDATLRMCPVCSRVFPVGRGTGIRSDAYFCCKQHKIEYFNRPEERKRRKRKGRQA